MRNHSPLRERTDRTRRNGFSLIELLIVIAIILIIAAIAIPNFIRTRLAANETAAISNLRTVSTAQVTYLTTYGNGYAPSLAALSGPSPSSCNNADLIDNALATGQKSGYNYVITPGAAVALPPPGCGPGANNYLITAVPANVGTTGQRSFCTRENAVIRQDPSGAPIPVGSCQLPLLAIQ